MLSILLRASLEGALLAAAVWMTCRVLPRLSPAVRALLWWCVAAKFVVSLVWHAPINVPVLPAQRASVPTALRNVIAAPSSSTTAVPAAPTSTDLPVFSFTALLLAVWALGVGVSLVRTLAAWRETRGVVSRSAPGDASLHAVVRELSAQLGVRCTADVRVSAEIESPLITGVRSPVILVPADRFAKLTPEQQRMALCHELAHVKRGDVWLGCVPALVERCFFFHPLARLAAREYAFWREAACDDAVLVTLGASPQSYGRLLLALGVSRQPANFAAAGAAWSFSNLKRRVTMLSHASSPSLGGRVLAAGAVALAIVAIVPVKAVARPATPAAAVAEPVIAPLLVSSVETAVASVQDRREQERRARERREEVRGERERTSQERYSQERTSSQDVNFVYLQNGDQTVMSGSRGDASRARRHQRSGEPLLWFHRDGQDYIVRDAKLLREVEELWEPVSRIGSEQGEIGTQQGALGMEQGKHGTRQGEIGAAQGLVGAKQGVIGARLGLLAVREAMGASASERREIEQERETLSRDQRALDREMEALGKQMREYNPPMRDLGDQMSVLGRQMAVLGERMQVASWRANTGMRSLIERAISSGAAEAVR